MLKVIGVGDNVFDIYRHTGTMYPGGNCVNFAVYARRLGHDASYMGVVADDRYGGILLDTLHACGIDTTYSEHVHGETGLCSTTIRDGDRTITDDNDNGAVRSTPLRLTGERLDHIARHDLAHSSCYSFIDDQLHRITDRGVPLVYDFSDKWDEARLSDLCPAVTFAFFSGKGLPDGELKRLLGEAVDRHGCRLAITTIGKRGAIIYNGARFYQSAPYNLDARVVDTLGAGDSFLTGFLATYMDGLKQAGALAGGEPWRHTTDDDRRRYEDALIDHAMQAGNLLAITTCMEEGAFGHGVPFHEATPV